MKGSTHGDRHPHTRETAPELPQSSPANHPQQQETTAVYHTPASTSQIPIGASGTTTSKLDLASDTPARSNNSPRSDCTDTDREIGHLTITSTPVKLLRQQRTLTPPRPDRPTTSGLPTHSQQGKKQQYPELSYERRLSQNAERRQLFG